MRRGERRRGVLQIDGCTSTWRPRVLPCATILQEATYQDEVGPNIGCGIEVGGVGAPQVAEIVSLKNKDEDPIDACHDAIEGKWRVHMAVLAPYCMAVGMVIAVDRRIKSVVAPKN